MLMQYKFSEDDSIKTYTCDVCGKSVPTMHKELRDFDLICCEHRHTFCYDHAVEPDKPCVQKDSFGEFHECNNMFEAESIDYRVPKQYCPICNMIEISDTDYKRYLEITHRGKDMIQKEIKDKFNSYEEFSKFLEASHIH